MRSRVLLPLALTILLGISAHAQSYTESTIYNFGASSSDGTDPFGNLVFDKHGNIYGVTFQGGSAGFGTVFKLDPQGNETILHSFVFSDGTVPQAGLVIDTAGNLYGTTSQGGSTSSRYPTGHGTVFKITAAGQFSVLHKFQGKDGQRPVGQLILDSAGNIYGGTSQGGGVSDGGVIFKITPSGQETTLFTFHGKNGSSPQGNLLRNMKGEIYGSTLEGGTGAFEGGGTVFSLSPSGKETVLYSFCQSGTNCPDGIEPFYMVRTANGTLYGNTAAGGAMVNGGPNGQGVIYSINGQGAFSVVYTFCPQGPNAFCTDGYQPIGPLAAFGGNIYGSTLWGGDADMFSLGVGLVFEITPDGVENVLYRFPNDFTQGGDLGGITVDSAGNLYGVAEAGGAHDGGVVFKLTRNN